MCNISPGQISRQVQGWSDIVDKNFSKRVLLIRHRKLCRKEWYVRTFIEIIAIKVLARTNMAIFEVINGTCVVYFDQLSGAART